MDRIFTICIIIAILALFFFFICNQDSDNDRRNIPNVPRFKNCLSRTGTDIAGSRVPINEECPPSTITCPQYFGCNNENIPFCRNKDINGNYGNISCPKCVDGNWKCDYFSMGTSGIITTPFDGTQINECSSADGYATGQDRFNCEFDLCRELGDDCKWSSFNSGGTMTYADKGVPSDSKISGYMVSSTGDSPVFHISLLHDAGEHLGGAVDTIDGVSPKDCIAKAKKSYSYTDPSGNVYNYNGSYGFVYDFQNKSCDLHRMAYGVVASNTTKLVKGG